MNAERLVLIIAVSLTRDLEAEGALARALARSGGDGLTACSALVDLCPKPCLRHRRVNVGIWPNWRMNQRRRWDFDPDKCPARHEYEHDRCQNFGAHLDRETLKLKLANYVQHRRNQEWDYDPYVFWSSTPSGQDSPLTATLNSMMRQARSISENMGISHLWNREPNKILTGPEPLLRWTVTSPPPRPFEGRTYLFDLTDDEPSPSP